MFLSSSLELNQSPISSFTAFLVVFKSPAMMMLGTGAGAWPCDKARAAASRLLSRRCTNCSRTFIAHSALNLFLSWLFARRLVVVLPVDGVDARRDDVDARRRLQVRLTGVG